MFWSCNKSLRKRYTRWLPTREKYVEQKLYYVQYFPFQFFFLSPQERLGVNLFRYLLTTIFFNINYLIYFHLAKPQVRLSSGPIHARVGQNITLPKCHVTGFPKPVVSWKRLTGALAKKRAVYNQQDLTVIYAEKTTLDRTNAEPGTISEKLSQLRPCLFGRHQNLSRSHQTWPLMGLVGQCL